jgi:hypothetical protein
MLWEQGVIDLNERVTPLGIQATSGSADQRCESLPKTLDLATRRRRGAPEMLLCDDESTGGRYQDDDGAALNRDP